MTATGVSKPTRVTPGLALSSAVLAILANADEPLTVASIVSTLARQGPNLREAAGRSEVQAAIAVLAYEQLVSAEMRDGRFAVSTTQRSRR